MGRGGAGDLGLQGLGDLRGREAKRLDARLIEFQRQARGAFAPADLGAAGARRGTQRGQHVIGHGAHRLHVGADDAELNGEAHGRAEFEAGDAHAGFRHALIGEEGHQPGAGTFAAFHAAGGGQHHGGDGIVRQSGVHGQLEARAAAADIGGEPAHIALQLGVGLQPGLDLGHRGGRGGMAGALAQCHVQQQLRPGGGGEELLLHHAHPGAGEHQQRHGAQHHGAAPPDRPLHHAAQRAVDSGFVHVVVGVRAGLG